MSHDTQLAPQTLQRDLVMALLKMPDIMTRKTMTGMATEAIKPTLLMSGTTRMTTSLTHCRKSRVNEKMMMSNKISLIMWE